MTNLKKKGSTIRFKPIVDKHTTYKDIQQALRKVGLESSQLVIGIDYTKSNTWNGEKTFGGRCLHDIQQNSFNYYQQAIDLIGKTLSDFDDDGMIPTYGFGDITTGNHSVFRFNIHSDCQGIGEVMARYIQITPQIKLSGPTSFAPLINTVIDIVKKTKEYTILLILCDGQVDGRDRKETEKAIVRASRYPISIVCIGVGDGPWDTMEKFDDELPKRKFDNFQFVNFRAVTYKSENPEVEFIVAALQEIPDQYRLIKKLGYI